MTEKKQFVRIWVELDMREVRKHLLIADESLGSCATCKEVGLEVQSVKQCPQCGCEFKYVTARARSLRSRPDPVVLRRIRDKRPELTLVDWEDYDRGEGKVSAREFLKL